MGGAIRALLETILDLIHLQNLHTNIGSGLRDFMQEVYNIVIGIQENAMQPVAYTILAIFILLEIQKISTKVEQAGGAPTLGFELIFKTLVKLIICKMVVDNVQVILDAILGTSNALINNIFEVGQDNRTTEALIDQFMDYLPRWNFWNRMAALINLVMINIVALVLRVYIEVTLYIRYFELYVFAAIAPLPVATIPNEEFSSIGKSFFKGFVAVGLQGVFLALVMTIYPVILKEILNVDGPFLRMGQLSGYMVVQFALLLYMLIIFLSINKTKQWAKSIVNVS